MLSTWVKDDVEIIRRLKERFMGTQSTELNIIAFEELSQNQTENDKVPGAGTAGFR